MQVSVTELIGEAANLPHKPGPVSRLQQQVEQISRLPRAKQKLASDLLDTVLAQHCTPHLSLAAYAKTPHRGVWGSYFSF
ncbi:MULTISPECIES: hypothetical protein [unclassified Cupriavidus]|uniref:hypothetical protein n=1 Tax=Cupriavidus sp. H19C3 TaxID=3241603 RepID=UPI003BF818E2